MSLDVLGYSASNYVFIDQSARDGSGHYHARHLHFHKNILGSVLRWVNLGVEDN